MVRRLLNCAMLIAILTVFASPAYADNNGRGQGGGNGNGSGSSSSDGGSPGNSNGAGNSENAASAGGSPSGNPSGKEKSRGKADEDVALEAVQADDALPLKDILRELRKSTDDKVIDARLFSRNGVLVYELKVLGSDGRVRIHRYEAGSGKRITTR